MATALVMARAPRPGECKTRLEPLLGPERCARLQAVLVRRAADWAAAVAPERALVAFDPADAEDELPRLVPAAVELVPQAAGDCVERLQSAVGLAFERFGGPLLVVGTGLPRLGPGHAAAALLDMAEGADATFGPALDGGYYLVALREPRPELLGPARSGPGDDSVLARTLALAAERRLEVGLMRTERELGTPADAAAMLADPLLPLEVRAALTS